MVLFQDFVYSWLDHLKNHIKFISQVMSSWVHKTHQPYPTMSIQKRQASRLLGGGHFALHQLFSVDRGDSLILSKVWTWGKKFTMNIPTIDAPMFEGTTTNINNKKNTIDPPFKTRWSPRTRMPTRMLTNRDNTYLSRFQQTHLWDTLSSHTEVTLL